MPEILRTLDLSMQHKKNIIVKNNIEYLINIIKYFAQNKKLVYYSVFIYNKISPAVRHWC